MEIIKEWLPLIVLGFNAAMFCVIKFNDLHHISEAVKVITNKIEKLDDRSTEHGERISKIEGKLCAKKR